MLTRLVSAASIVCLLAGAAHGQVTYRTVAVSGHLAPGLGGAMFASATFPIVGAPSINTHGQTAFAAQINVNPDGCLWSEGLGTLTLIAREGEAAPETGGALFKDFYLRAAPINDDGVIAFTHGLEGHGVTTANNAGIWSNTTGALALIVRKGDVAPGAGGSLFSDLGRVLLNNSGDIAFYALVTSPSNGSLWTNAAGTLTIIARDSLRPQASPSPRSAMSRHSPTPEISPSTRDSKARASTESRRLPSGSQPEAQPQPSPFAAGIPLPDSRALPTTNSRSPT